MAGAVMVAHGAMDARSAASALADPSAGTSEPWRDLPWVAAGELPGGSLVAECSSMWAAGLFWGVTTDQVVVGADPRSVALALGDGSLDPDYLRGFATGRLAPHLTPYRRVHRLGPGTRARWEPGDWAPAIRPWHGPEIRPAPDLHGSAAVALYREVFARALDTNRAWLGSSLVSLSAGLDSTFLAAMMARDPGQRAHGFHAAPLPDARLEPLGAWDPDESELVELFAARHRGRLDLRIWRNESLRHPLAAARAAAVASGVPTFNPGNQLRRDAISTQCRELGLTGWWTGAYGNAAFSHPHSYAVGSSGTTLAARVRRALHRPGVRRAIHSRGPGWATPAAANPWQEGGLLRPGQHLPPTPPAVTSRADYLRWLNGPGSALAAASNPAASPMLRVDPFRALSVLEVAARIDPATWRLGELPRGFARACGEGLVPDPIRLRTRRGAQSWDSWFVVRNDRERYADLAAAVGSTPGLEFIDNGALSRLVQGWPWGEVAGPPPHQVNVVNRVLALSLFVQDAAHWAADANGRGGPVSTHPAPGTPGGTARPSSGAAAATPAVIVRSARQPRPDPAQR